ncbi:hypothetical protein [Planktothrix tepida]|nr:hypothetical protein [Planktothrix tepida]
MDEFSLKSVFSLEEIVSDEKYKNSFSKLKMTVDILSDESDQDNLTNLLRDMGMKYSMV